MQHPTPIAVRRRARFVAVRGLLVLVAAVAIEPVALGASLGGPDPIAARTTIHVRAHIAPRVSHEVYAYLPYWNLGPSTAGRLDYGSLSTIAMFAVPFAANGALDRHALGYRAYVSASAAAVTNAAHAQGVRVVPTFQLFDPAKLRRLLASRAAQNRFIRQAIALMRSRRADGANIDVEPIPMHLATRFAAFVGRFERKVHRAIPGSQVVVATSAGVSGTVIDALKPVVDRFFVMAYDFNTQASTRPGPIAPLSGGTWTVATQVDRYLRHVPASQIVLGVGFYGYSWPVRPSRSGMLVRRDPGRYGGVHGVTYASARQFLADHPRIKVHSSPGGGSWFRWNDSVHHTVREVHFEDANSARAKYDLTIEQGLAGIGVWALGADSPFPTMRRVIRRTFVTPVRRLTMNTTSVHVRDVKGRVRVSGVVRLHDQGTIPERGILRWRILDRHGHTVARGARTTVVGRGTTARVAVTVSLGWARLRAAGIYRLSVTFMSQQRTWTASTVRFRQRY
jgi:spore germination protein YaaH